MGNTPSAPSPQVTTAPPPQVTTPPPPPTAVCDANCQRQKELTNLRTALDTATANKTSDPETYQKARIAYYTTLEGQGWLDKERMRIGEEEVGPLVTQINEKYKTLVEEKKSQSTFLGLLDVLTAEKQQNQEELKYIYDQTAQTINKQITTDRTNELGGNTTIDPIGAYYPLIFQILLAILSIIIIVLLYRRFIPSSSTSMSVGGKRVPH